MTRHLRFAIGRWLMHAGLHVLPRGRARTELHEILTVWGLKVRATVAASRPSSQGDQSNG